VVRDRWGGKGVMLARVPLHSNANQTEVNWVAAALRRHGESYREAVIRLAKEAQG
jgi:hypothetical protein